MLKKIESDILKQDLKETSHVFIYVKNLNSDFINIMRI